MGRGRRTWRAVITSLLMNIGEHVHLFLSTIVRTPNEPRRIAHVITAGITTRTRVMAMVISHSLDNFPWFHTIFITSLRRLWFTYISSRIWNRGQATQLRKLLLAVPKERERAIGIFKALKTTLLYVCLVIAGVGIALQALVWTARRFCPFIEPTITLVVETIIASIRELFTSRSDNNNIKNNRQYENSAMTGTLDGALA
ncbi:hypothetical protein F5B22DRAFT_595443 [Xylaria bambusicola]|uniref:uncharacterized protein n=1 Tax=Xylaria bambusicola TaxID=326684 RepID=UPI002007959D|nr:uncharacterized protein F5B22DRAFT_595443 [Xylaria bambusicola]KAI0521567.1 hypothetical protein F5B22DRAFT_595443 [Xylaria bambusicola]